MKTKQLVVALMLAMRAVRVQAQQKADRLLKRQEKKYQTTPPKTRPFGKEAFAPSRWFLDIAWRFKFLGSHVTDGIDHGSAISSAFCN